MIAYYPYKVSSSASTLFSYQDLYRWLQRQKTTRYEKRTLDPQSSEALSDTELGLLRHIGVAFAISPKWSEQYQKLVAYKEANYEDSDNRPLEVDRKIDKVQIIFLQLNPHSYYTLTRIYFYPFASFQSLYHWLYQQKNRRYDQRALVPRPVGALSNDELEKLQAIGVVFT